MTERQVFKRGLKAELINQNFDNVAQIQVKENEIWIDFTDKATDGDKIAVKDFLETHNFIKMPSK